MKSFNLQKRQRCLVLPQTAPAYQNRFQRDQLQPGQNEKLIFHKNVSINFRYRANHFDQIARSGVWRRCWNAVLHRNNSCGCNVKYPALFSPNLMINLCNFYFALRRYIVGAVEIVLVCSETFCVT